MNAIIIEQNQGETSLASEVNQNAAITRIRVARARIASQAMDEGPKSPIEVMFSFKSKPITAPANIMRLEIAFRMAGVKQKEAGKKGESEMKPDPVVVVECAYEVDYVLQAGFSITPEHVKAFKDGNAIFNVWPYFREYLQSNLQRMGFPPLTAPFLRLQLKAKPRKQEKPELEAKKRLLGQSRN
jgi:hypothetical protein